MNWRGKSFNKRIIASAKRFTGVPRYFSFQNAAPLFSTKMLYLYIGFHWELCIYIYNLKTVVLSITRFKLLDSQVQHPGHGNRPRILKTCYVENYI